jgi:23S rRNA (cytosine1962-C5)-methyltransferase
MKGNIMEYAVVKLKKGEGRTLRAGGMWVFDNEIDTVIGTYENGGLVEVHDMNEFPLGIGFIKD